MDAILIAKRVIVANAVLSVLITAVISERWLSGSATSCDVLISGVWVCIRCLLCQTVLLLLLSASEKESDEFSTSTPQKNQTSEIDENSIYFYFSTEESTDIVSKESAQPCQEMMCPRNARANCLSTRKSNQIYWIGMYAPQFNSLSLLFTSNDL